MYLFAFYHCTIDSQILDTCSLVAEIEKLTRIGIPQFESDVDDPMIVISFKKAEDDLIFDIFDIVHEDDLAPQ